jgi:hypothetical protein
VHRREQETMIDDATRDPRAENRARRARARSERSPLRNGFTRKEEEEEEEEEALAIHRLIRFRKIFSKITSDPGQNRSENSA